ncbi:MAG: N-acetyl-gamma-glutamyl-phosphate reductase [Actinobacteria bacterium]|uniref:N-acetyl-gamma-glutamyl-phosphate reductase n=1 Tax=freshwater metagenome TaxID=449393 RepID=A0A6J6I860_9ZZZZ|nr:N-acetyl-gamma-glutamyl-phosphate reductase [Actinomycetota bacterium]MSX34218.1 N-acetyl-gamma-glutamyl-phosphate reductase [Actinomycetota bacterium]MSX96050.1 N-acetyl-gamma-glutamyl-phosphate reductase [Actinomycetota bacterium]MSY24941.1 N-acetyl-gamma-glutamyl-phosphate reductase [Actinomycetota bacterium]MSY34168.1 N-acetyl-gamma-glutamyl-phosphate reductase [Actinomycetota bacterium]
MQVTSVGILGASGFTGAELLRLLANHPGFDLAFATGESQAGVAVRDLYPSLSAVYADVEFKVFEPSLLDGVDLVFCGLPHGASQSLMPTLVENVKWVVDLAADFRLQDAALYPKWYGEAHPCPELLPKFAYGLPELYRSQIVGASAVAVPGCYPTCTSLAIAPLITNGLVQLDSIVVDAASGVSGAGRPPKPNTTFCTVDEDYTAYGLLNHRHTPEIEQNIATLASSKSSEVSVLFTPHLAPMNRGMLATCYLKPTGSQSTEQLLEIYEDFYADEQFVVVTDGSPSTKACLGSNTAHVTVRADERTGHIVAIGAIDNLTKGASGQAVQCANILAGIPEATGLSSIGVYP